MPTLLAILLDGSGVVPESRPASERQEVSAPALNKPLLPGNADLVDHKTLELMAGFHVGGLVHGLPEVRLPVLRHELEAHRGPRTELPRQQ